jgi:hypothetical protein
MKNQDGNSKLTRRALLQSAVSRAAASTTAYLIGCHQLGASDPTRLNHEGDQSRHYVASTIQKLREDRRVQIGAMVTTTGRHAADDGAGGDFMVAGQLPAGFLLADNQWYIFSSLVLDGIYFVRLIPGTVSSATLGIYPAADHVDGFDLTIETTTVLTDRRRRSVFSEECLGYQVYVEGAALDGASHGGGIVSHFLNANCVQLHTHRPMRNTLNTSIKMGKHYDHRAFEALRRYMWFDKGTIELKWEPGEYFLNWNEGGAPFPQAKGIRLIANDVTFVVSDPYLRMNGTGGPTITDHFNVVLGSNSNGFNWHMGHSIHDLNPGGDIIYFIEKGAAKHYCPGNRLLISAVDQFGYGYPPDCHSFHFTSVDQALVERNAIKTSTPSPSFYPERSRGGEYLSGPTNSEMLAGYWDMAKPGAIVKVPRARLKYTDQEDLEFARYGPAHCLNLDQVDELDIFGNSNIMNGDLYIEGLRIVRAYDIADRNCLLNCSSNEVVRCKKIRVPGITLSVNRKVELIECELGDFQPDKLIEELIWDSCICTSMTHSTGVKRLAITGGRWEGCIPQARSVEMSGILARFTAGADQRLQQVHLRDVTLQDPFPDGSGPFFGVSPEFDSRLSRQGGGMVRVQTVRNDQALLIVPSDDGMRLHPIRIWEPTTYRYGETVYRDGAFYRCALRQSSNVPGRSADWRFEKYARDFVVCFAGRLYRALVENPNEPPLSSSQWGEVIHLEGQTGYRALLHIMQPGARIFRSKLTLPYAAPKIDNEGFIAKMQWQDIRGGAVWIYLDRTSSFQPGDYIGIKPSDIEAVGTRFESGGRDPYYLSNPSQTGCAMPIVQREGGEYLARIRIGPPPNRDGIELSSVIWPRKGDAEGQRQFFRATCAGRLKWIRFDVLRPFLGNKPSRVIAVSQTTAGFTNIGVQFNLLEKGLRTLVDGLWTELKQGDTAHTGPRLGTYINGLALDITELEDVKLSDVPILEVTYCLFA